MPAPTKRASGFQGNKDLDSSEFLLDPLWSVESLFLHDREQNKAEQFFQKTLLLLRLLGRALTQEHHTQSHLHWGGEEAGCGSHSVWQLLESALIQ